MIFIPVISSDLPVTIKLSKSYAKSSIGLVDFHINGFKEPTLIDVTCNQIDSTVENPKRILKVCHYYV
jgi:hypothetical protein